MRERTLDEQLTQVEAELVAATGGSGMCRTASVDVKFLEGKYTALRALRATPAHLNELLAEAIHACESVADGRRGEAWLNYERGRVAALREAKDLLGSAPP
jgi:hypothetical protein